MAEAPVFSIVIPMFKEGAHLSESIKRIADVLDSIGESYEILLVDDGSLDNARLPEALRTRHPLALVGARGWLNNELERHLAPLERTGQLRRLGYVPEEDLHALYAGAHAFAYPSLYEGFGLPLLEAMASGVPALSSNCSSLPEVAGDAALLVDPEDLDALTIGLERLLGDEPWRAWAKTRGLEQASRFSWDCCVEETVAVYRRLLGETAHG